MTAATDLSRPLKILYMIDEMVALSAGGTERQIFQMIQMMQESGADVHLCVLRGTEWVREGGFGVSLYWAGLTSFHSASGMAALWRLFRWMGKQRFDVVQTFFVESNLVGPVVAKVAGVPVVLGSRRNLNYWMSPATARLQSFCNMFATRLVANCEAVKRVIADMEHTNPAKIDVIYNGLDLAQFQPDAQTRADARRELGVSEGQILVGNTSSLRPVKGTELFVDVAARVHAEHPNARFVLVGDGPLRAELEQRARKAGVGDALIFTGAKLDVARYLQAFDIGVLSSESEGFSNSILEYMAMGLPVVATDVGGNAEALEDCGVVVPPRDLEALATAVAQMLTDRAEALAMGECARWKVQKFSVDAARRTLYEYYCTLLSR